MFNYIYIYKHRYIAKMHHTPANAPIATQPLNVLALGVAHIASCLASVAKATETARGSAGTSTGRQSTSAHAIAGCPTFSDQSSYSVEARPSSMIGCASVQLVCQCEQSPGYTYSRLLPQRERPGQVSQCNPGTESFARAWDELGFRLAFHFAVAWSARFPTVL